MSTIHRILAAPFLTFGPLFIVLSSSTRTIVAYAGAVMLAVGLAMVLRTVHAQQKAIEELRTRLGES